MQVVISQSDLLWVTEFSAPRFGLGAFATALEALHTATVGEGFHDKVVYGKPTAKPYSMAHEMLTEQVSRLQGARPLSLVFCLVRDYPITCMRPSGELLSGQLSRCASAGSS